VPELSLVALEDDRVIGHVMFSRAHLDTGIPLLALAPMAVLPDRQREGIGQEMVKEGLARAARLSFAAVVVVGHAGYYPRFGFEPARPHGIEAPVDVPDGAWMVYRVPGNDASLRGRVVYPPPFGGL
jgi:putative acetyltransferase